jgi:hypothetical protein
MLRLLAHRAAPTAAGAACAATGEEVHCDQVAHTRRTSESLNRAAGGDDVAGDLVTRGYRIQLLLADEQAPLECAEPTGADGDE